MEKIGRYEVEDRLHEDELGVVYEAMDPEAGERVELRVLPAGLLKGKGRKQFLAGVQRLAALDIEAVSGWIDSFEEEGRLILVHQRLEGETLRDRLSGGAVLEWREAVLIASEVSEALAAVHALEPPLVHGDLRPENIVKVDGRHRLRDFLLAELVDELSERETLAVARLRYLSPEQMEGLEAQPSDDLYALGLIFFEMVTGNQAFDEQSVSELEARKRSFEITLPASLKRKLPERLLKLLSSMSSGVSDARPTNAGDVRAELRALLKGSPKEEESDILSSYVERVMALSAQRSSALSPEELREIALELGMSEDELAAADEAAEGHLLRGQGYLSHKLWEDAIEQLGSAAALAPMNVDMAFALAQAYAGRWRAKNDKEDCLEAQRLTRRCVELDPRFDQAYELLADLDEELDDYVAEPAGTLTVTAKARRGRVRNPSRRRKPASKAQLAIVALLAALLSSVGLFYFDPMGLHHQQPAVEHTTTIIRERPPEPKPPTPSPSPTPIAETPLQPPQPTPVPGEVLIPAGSFLLGSPTGEGDADEHPQRSLVLDSYSIDAREVSVAEYRECVEAGICSSSYFSDHTVKSDCSYDGGNDALPMNCVSPHGAELYCAWRGKQSGRVSRLPTEAEWEKAARGDRGQRYSWGTGHCKSNELGCGSGFVSANNSSDLSPYGVQDMGGNLSEWTLAFYDTTPKASELVAGAPHSFSIRGGNYANSGPVRSADRAPIPTPQGTAGANAQLVGFRCVTE